MELYCNYTYCIFLNKLYFDSYSSEIHLTCEIIPFTSSSRNSFFIFHTLTIIEVRIGRNMSTQLNEKVSKV